MAVTIVDYYGDGHLYADTVFTEEGRVTCVLGPDGEPVRYLKRNKVGFDLRQQNNRGEK